MNTSVRKLTFSAVIAALYAALTMLLAPISYGAVQLRLSEVMCILPFFFPASAWGLFVGCMVANLLSMFGLVDVVFGSMATLLAALCTVMIGRTGRENIAVKALACLPPVLFNAVIIGAVIAWFSTPGDLFWAGFWVNALNVGLGEAAVMYAVGLPLMVWLPKTAFFNKLRSTYDF